MFFFIPMKVFVSPVLVPGRVPIRDDGRDPKVDPSEDYQLVFTDGSQTLKVFKMLYLKNIDAYFVVQNLEYFMHKMRVFRNLEFAVLETPRRHSDGSELSSALFVMGDGCRMDDATSKYMEIERRLRPGKTPEDLQRGVELSFRPRVLEAIRTSLASSSAYRSAELACHRIFDRLSRGKATLEELESTEDGTEEVHSAVKSMMHAGIVLRRESHFYLNELMK